MSVLFLWVHVQISESAGLEVWTSRGSREKEEEVFPRAEPGTMSGLSGLSARTLSFSELAAGPGTYPSPPWLPEPSSSGALSICSKFIRLPSVCVAIMAAPSCCSSESSYGFQRPCRGAAETLLTLADCSHHERTSPPSRSKSFLISASSISTSSIMFPVCLLNPIC